MIETGSFLSYLAMLTSDWDSFHIVKWIHIINVTSIKN
ncbi:unnamed protein product [Amoebophrya sp. A25]|nr:unnamed protein product [Amoebophrya sp. A25]|eukprot:GSA25T00021743001.1